MAFTMLNLKSFGSQMTLCHLLASIPWYHPRYILFRVMHLTFHKVKYDKTLAIKSDVGKIKIKFENVAMILWGIFHISSARHDTII